MRTFARGVCGRSYTTIATGRRGLTSGKGGEKMSMYGDDENGNRKNDLHNEMVSFLEDHQISELLEMVALVVSFVEN